MSAGSHAPGRSQSLLRASPSQLADSHLDIAEPRHGVDVTVKDDGSVLWVNVDGICVLRICRIPAFTYSHPLSKEEEEKLKP